VMPCGWGVKAGMVRVWVAGKTVWSPCYTRDISECFRDKELIYKVLYKFAFFTFYFTFINSFKSLPLVVNIIAVVKFGTVTVSYVPYLSYLSCMIQSYLFWSVDNVTYRLLDDWNISNDCLSSILDQGRSQELLKWDKPRGLGDGSSPAGSRGRAPVGVWERSSQKSETNVDKKNKQTANMRQ